MGKAIRKRQEAEAAKAVNLPAIFAARKLPPGFSPFSGIAGYEQYALQPLDQFVPRTRSKDPDVRVLELVRYAFYRYPVAKFLQRAWYGREERKAWRGPRGPLTFDPKAWYIALTQGRSLYREYFKDAFTKQETHRFATCALNVPVHAALWYAVAQNAMLINTRLIEHIPDDFYRGVARWFTEHPTTSREADDMLDYIENRHADNGAWHLKDHTLLSLRRAMAGWHRELGRVSVMAARYPRWDGLDVADWVTERVRDGNLFHWQCKQIKTGRELAAEGNRMHHCVSSYAARCAKGDCSIWSLTKWLKDKGWHQLTIELAHGVIVQARGFANRLPNAEELSVVKQWAEYNRFATRLRGWF